MGESKVAVFTADPNEINMEQWLRTIDATGDIFNWDEKHENEQIKRKCQELI